MDPRSAGLEPDRAEPATDRRDGADSPRGTQVSLTLPRVVSLARAAHPGPVAAVTMLAAALAAATELPVVRIILVTGAVLAGQLSIGWCNDLVDRARDIRVGRRDKPLATGELPIGWAQSACLLAVVGTVALSLLCGITAGLVHLGCVAAGWTYNLGLKSTSLSWLPYALAFGGLPIFITLAEPGAGLPPLWLPFAGALLGVGAHLVNVLPDLADDEATGVHGLPHRIGERWTPVWAVMILAAASVVIVIGSDSVPGVVVTPALLMVAALAGLALVTTGRAPFRAAIAIAFVDVIMLVVAR